MYCDSTLHLSEYRSNVMEFEYIKRRERAAQSFDKENITLTKAGKTFNVYDKIQEGREDTEIYPTLEKYGCIDRMMLDHQGIYDDFTKYGNLRDIKEQQKMANQMFYDLPLEVRQTFNNDISVFMRDGEKYMKKLVDADIAKAKEMERLNNEAIKTPVVETPVIKGDVA